MQHAAEDFIDRICAEAVASRAVDHPYLQAMSTASLPDMNFALQDFAYQYGGYSRHFTRYVCDVIEQLSDDHHREILLDNLAEEEGQVDGVDLPESVLASIGGVPHATLYQRFQHAVGVDPAYVSEAELCASAKQWSEQFLVLCQMNQWVGIGAIGIGTELIVSRVYQQILSGIRSQGKLTPEQHVFFDLHSQCDDEHAAQMISIAAELAHTAEQRQQIEFGVVNAIHLRIQFWDELLTRAESHSRNHSTRPLGEQANYAY